MSEISRSQVLVYGAVAVALLFVGARAIRAESGAGGPSVAEAASSSGGDDLSFSSGGSGSVVVDVAGAVRKPGVYSLPAGARVKDAIARAGGPSAGALLEAINRAARVADGQQVVVPEVGPGGSVAGRHRRRAGRRADQPRHGHRRAARHDRGHRAGHGAEHRRFP